MLGVFPVLAATCEDGDGGDDPYVDSSLVVTFAERSITKTVADFCFWTSMEMDLSNRSNW